MAHITNKLRGLVAAFVAVFAALALVPGTALADNLAGEGSLKVGPFKEAVQVDIYRVVEYNANTVNGTYSWKFANGLTLQNDRNETITIDEYAKLNDDQMKDAAGQMATWARLQVPTKEGSAAAGGSVEFTDLEPGQYLILVTATGEDSSTIYQNMVADLKPTQDGTTGKWTIEAVTVSEIKSSDKPDIDKDITGDVEDTDETDEYKVGDWVPFTITANIPVYPNDQWANTTFKITDVMSKGLTAPTTGTAQYYQIKINDADASSYLKGPISVTSDDSGETTVVFDFDYVKLANAGLVGDEMNVTITYSARINDSVKVITGTTETNEAKLDFGQSDSSESTTDTVEVDTYAISIKKTDADTEAALKDAEFGVYTNKDCTDMVGTIATNEEGIGFLAGLKAGTYYVKETQAPGGYQLDSTVHTVTVPAAGDNDNNVNLNITNKKDIPGLPTTGGAGTVALTAAGVVLIAGAAAFIVRSRKQS